MLLFELHKFPRLFYNSILFPGLSNNSILFPRLSSPRKCKKKVPRLSKSSRTHIKPVCIFTERRFVRHIPGTFLRLKKKTFYLKIKPLTPMNDQDRISPNNINKISDENKEKYQYEDN